MIFGLLKDIKNGEYRTIATPGEIAAIVADGHPALVQKGAGERCGFADEAYEKAVEVFIDPGKKLCTEEEIGDIIEKYRKKLGISDEVYTYGDELKPEDD